MESKQRAFRTPRRRGVRQRSGFYASGDKTGNEVKLVRSWSLVNKSPHIVLHFENVERPLPNQFNLGLGMAALGGYIKPQNDCFLVLNIEVYDPLDNTLIGKNEKASLIVANHWSKFSVDIEVEDADTYENVNIQGNLEIKVKNGEIIGQANLFGINIDTVTAYSDKSIKDDYDA